MERRVQQRKAEQFLALHHDPKLLVLPNIWDPLGAGMLAELGYPAVATASWAIAHSLGYGDGQKIRFDALVGVVERIVRHVEVPVSVDAESGYGESPEEVARNMRLLLRAGAVGINLEDSVIGEKRLYSTDLQCERIRAIRRMAEGEGVPLVINARTDVFMKNAGGSPAANLAMAIERLSAYLKAGADCLYPIPVGDLATLTELRATLDAPINVYAGPKTASMEELEATGISRLSLGPGFLKACLKTMKQIAVGLQEYSSYDAFTQDTLPPDEIERYVRQEKMTPS